jgi:hypothetical protein
LQPPFSCFFVSMAFSSREPSRVIYIVFLGQKLVCERIKRIERSIAERGYVARPSWKRLDRWM